MRKFKLHNGHVLDVLKGVESESVHCVVTSPPYWGLRDYGVAGQVGLEPTPEAYVDSMVEIFREVKRVLRIDGTLWLNLGDSYSGSGKGRNPDGTAHHAGLQPNRKQSISKGTLIGNVQGGIVPYGCKPKDLVGIPWMTALALRADGWYLRSDIIWAKPNPMPESVLDRPTRSHEYIFLLSKSQRYYYDADAIRERAITSPDDGSHQSFGTLNGKTEATPGKSHSESGKKRQRKTLQDYGQSPHTKNINREIGIDDPDYLVRNKRDVWTVPTSPYPDAHFAVYPPDLIEPCILAGSKEGDTVLDPFCGAGTTGLVALRYGRNFMGIELNPEYVAMAEKRITGDSPLFNANHASASNGNSDDPNESSVLHEPELLFR